MIAALTWSVAASATTYFVSSSTGSDSNSGTSSAAPWQTIGHVNAQTFQAGDQVLFRRGDTWNESLVPPSSGASGNPIAFDSYGTGAPPNLTGYYSVPSSAWVFVSGHAWKAPLPATYTTINFCLFGSIWGQKVAASSSNLTAQWDFYFANGFVYVFSVGNPGGYYSGPIVPMDLSNTPIININAKSWLAFQHILVNWFDQYGVYVQGASDHLIFANMEADSMIPQGTQPLGFYVNESAPGPADIKIYNSEANLNYDGFRSDGVATAITMVNDKAYANRDGALVDNTGAVIYSHCHFYASSLAVAGSTDVEWTVGNGPTAGAGNIAPDTPPAVQAYARYPARVTLTVDDAGMTPGADTYYANTVLPIADTAAVPVGAAITVGYPLANTLVSEFQGWINAGRDVTSHSMSHTYYTNTDALDIQYTGGGTAATLSVSNRTLTITVTGAADTVTYNLTQGQARGTIQGLRQALLATGKFTATEATPCQGAYGTGCSAYTEAALLSQDLADVSSQDVKSAVYPMQLDVTRLTTDEITLSRQWMTSHLTGLPATPVFVYPGGYESTAMQGIVAGVPYAGARGALKEDLGVKDTYASGFNAQNITSFGVNPTWQGLQASALNQKVQALVWKQAVWGVPWGIFWHYTELSSTEITNLISDFKSAGATISTNTGLANWLLTGTQASGADGNYYYKSPASSLTLDFRPTKDSPVVDSGQNLGTSYQIDINGVNQNTYGSGWDIGAHVYVSYSAYGTSQTGAYFEIGAICGPPLFACSSISTLDPGPITPIFTSAAPTATACSGQCVNSVAYDTTINPWGRDPYVRITDGTTLPNGESVGGLTWSSGDNDVMSSVNDTYFGVNTGAVYILHMKTFGAPRPRMLMGQGINGSNSILTQPPPALGNSLFVTPDGLTTWDTCTQAPELEFNSTGLGRITINSGTATTVTFASGNPSSITNSEGINPSSTSSLFMLVSGVPYDLPLASCGATTCTLASASPVFPSSLASYGIFNWGPGSRIDTMRSNALTQNGPLLDVLGPTPNWRSGNSTDTNVHKASCHGNGSAFPPSDLSVTQACPGLLSGQTTTDCWLKGFVYAYVTHMSNRGMPVKQLAFCNECNHAPSDVINQVPTALSQSGNTATVTFASTCQFATNQSITLAGNTPSGYNGQFRVLAGCAGGSSFTFTNSTSGLGAGTVFGTVSCCDANAKVTSDGEWAGSIQDLAAAATDVAAYAKSASATPLKVAGPSADDVITGNGYNANAGCQGSIKGAPFLDNLYNILGLSVDAIAMHGYWGYLPESAGFALDTILTTCANLATAALVLPVWDTEESTAYSGNGSYTEVTSGSITHAGGVCTVTTDQQISGFAAQQQPNWLANGSERVVVWNGSGDIACNTGVGGAVITSVSNTSFTYAATGSGTVTCNKCFAYDYSIMARAWPARLAIEYHRLMGNGQFQVPLSLVNYWENATSTAIAGLPACDQLATTTETTCGSANSSVNVGGKALGEFLNWTRAGGGLYPKQSCFWETGQYGSGGPWSALWHCLGTRADGSNTEIVWFSDPSRVAVTYTVPAPGSAAAPVGTPGFGHVCAITDAGVLNCSAISGATVTIPAGGAPIYLER